MTTYAIVRNGKVEAHFSTNRPASDFPDIQSLLVVAPSNVKDGDLYDGANFTTPSAASILAAARAALADDAELSQRESALLMRAVLLAALDEFNLHALKINAILDAVDAATTLANLKSAVALIADYPQRTRQQLVTAIRNKITNGDEE